MQYYALKAVKVERIRLYGGLGKSITDKQKKNWGKVAVPALSAALQREFPGEGCFSERNLWRWFIAWFYAEYQSNENIRPLVAEIS